MSLKGKGVYALVVLSLVFHACKKNDSITPPNIQTLPKITTLEISSITASTAITGGNITDTGNTSITAKGVCYSSRDTLPDLNNPKTVHNSGSNNFKDTLTHLLRNTTYYVRAYATNTAGTAYGQAIKFTTKTQSLPVVFIAGGIKDITETTASLGGNVLDDGGTAIIEKGVCYSSTNTDPTIKTDSKTIVAGSELGSFSAKLTNLSPGTDYYVRIYAINNTDTGYSGVFSFHTRVIPSIVKDGDGNEYHPILIGEQVWLKENLKTTKFNNGTDIDLMEDYGVWKTLTTPAYCWYDNDINNKNIYGALYNWYVVDPTKGKNVCPSGFHVPTENEFKTLSTTIGNNGGALKEIGTVETSTGYWDEPNTGASNSTGFTARPGGRRDATNLSGFRLINKYATFWSSSVNTGQGSYISLSNINNNFYTGTLTFQIGGSVRCVRD